MSKAGYTPKKPTHHGPNTNNVRRSSWAVARFGLLAVAYDGERVVVKVLNIKGTRL